MKKLRKVSKEEMSKFVTKASIKSSSSGITLVALVVTIVVLLILAGITITTLLGENGIIQKAKEAKEKTEQDALNTQNYLNNLEDELSSALGEDTSTLAKLKQSGKTVTENTTVQDRNGKSITVPTGFKVVLGGTVDDGIVIEDGSGNQFVWVPVDGTNLKYEKHTYTYDDTPNDAGTIIADKTGWKTYYYSSYSDWHDEDTNAASVSKYGGFYIARYEAGLNQTINAGDNYGGTWDVKVTANNVNTGTPVSKKGMPAWNFISQTNAKTVAANMYPSNSIVKSQLIDGTAWDTVTNWIANTTSYNVTDSSTWGNCRNNEFSIADGLYITHTLNGSAWTLGTNWAKASSSSTFTKAVNTRTEMGTGVAGYSVKNIYDFAGNMWEWTTEIGRSDGYAVLRGGSFDNNGSDCPACYRNGGHTTSNTHGVRRLPRCALFTIILKIGNRIIYI